MTGKIKSSKPICAAKTRREKGGKRHRTEVVNIKKM